MSEKPTDTMMTSKERLDQRGINRVHQIKGAMVEHIRESLALDVLHITAAEKHEKCCSCFEMIADVMSEDEEDVRTVERERIAAQVRKMPIYRMCAVDVANLILRDCGDE